MWSQVGWPGLGRWRQDRRARVSLSCVAAWEPTADQRGGRSAGAPRGCTTVTTTHQLVILRVVLAEELVDGSKEQTGGVGGGGGQQSRLWDAEGWAGVKEVTSTRPGKSDAIMMMSLPYFI